MEADLETGKVASSGLYSAGFLRLIARGLVLTELAIEAALGLRISGGEARETLDRVNVEEG